MIDLVEIEKNIRKFLKLKYELVGVTIKRDGEIIEGKKPERPLRYCRFVKLVAESGSEFSFTKDDISCPNAHFSLGMREPLYSELEPRIRPTETKGVHLAPLKYFNEKPDVILFVLNPIQAMQITQLVNIFSKRPIEATFSGERGVCGEATAKTYMSQEPNLTLLCNGARMFGGFEDNELIMGLPYEFVEKISETIEQITRIGGGLCGCITNDIPPMTTQAMEELGLDMSTDYFFGLINGREVRVYLNKDKEGEFRWITVHIPERYKSKEQAEKIAENLRTKTKETYYLNQRGRYVDVAATIDTKAIGANFASGEGVKEAVTDLLNALSEKFKKQLEVS